MRSVTHLPRIPATSSPVLPNQSQLAAKAFVERALACVRDLDITHSGDPMGQLTLSAGIAAFSANHRSDTGTLLGKADAALYAAKAAGRNRVELAV